MTLAPQSSDELSQEDAVALVAASVRRLFGFVPERQALDLAAAVLQDLRKQGIRLARNPASGQES